MTEQTEEAVKEVTEQKMYGEMMEYTSATSFEELKAQKKAEELAEVVRQFPQMVTNILNRPDIEDKSEAIRSLAVEFTGLANEMLSKEIKKEVTEQVVSKEEHYKAVQDDDTQANDNDFQGGCPACEFGEKELLTNFSKCPYCWGEL